MRLTFLAAPDDHTPARHGYRPFSRTALAFIP
jgi:hypothetical protein